MLYGINALKILFFSLNFLKVLQLHKKQDSIAGFLLQILWDFPEPVFMEHFRTTPSDIKYISQENIRY